MNKYSLYSKIFIIQVIFLLFLPPLGELNTVKGVILYGFYGLLSLIVVINYVFKEKIKFSKPTYFAIAFFLICLITGFAGMISNDTPFSDLIRGILPFSWYIYIIFLPYLKKFEYDAIIKVITVVGVIRAVQIIIYYFVYVYGNAGQRVTFYLVEAISMMTMVATLILIYAFIKSRNRYKKIVYLILSLITYIAIVLTATKSMVLAVLVAMIVLIALMICKDDRSKRNTLIKSCFIICVLLIVTFVGMSNNDIGNRWKESGNIIKEEIKVDSSNDNDPEKVDNTKEQEENITDGSVGPRIIEYKVAISNWKESPIIGKGIGFRWKSDEVEYGEPVMFMHNMVVYLLMDTGLLGMVFLVLLIISIMKLLISLLINKRGIHDYILSFSVIILAFVYGNFFAIFRNIEFTLMCVFFVSYLINEYYLDKRKKDA